MLFVEMTLCYSAGNEKTLNTQYKDFFFTSLPACHLTVANLDHLIVID